MEYEILNELKTYLLKGNKEKLIEYLNHTHAIDISFLLEEFDDHCWLFWLFDTISIESI